MLWCVLTVCGCEMPPTPAEQNVTTMRVPDGERTTDSTSSEHVVSWQPVPKRIRIYPSTRFIRESDDAILEARFELFDEMGDSVKAPGTFRIELYSVDEVQGGAPKKLLYAWDPEKTATLTLEQQREHYDPITRGYLFRLGVDDLRIANQPTLLKVVFTQIDQQRLEAEAIIRADW